MRTSISSAGDVVDEVAVSPMRLTPRYLHSVGHVENLTLTAAAAIDDTSNAKANVITGNGTHNVLSGLAELTR
jgi:hypothetical protein